MARSNFYFLFVGPLILLAAGPFLEGVPKSGALIQLAFTSVLVLGVFTLAGDGRVFHLGLGLAAISLVAAAGLYQTGDHAPGHADLPSVLAASHATGLRS